MREQPDGVTTAIGAQLPPDGSQPVLARLVAGLRRGGTHWMVVGSGVSGVAAYVFQIVGTRSLGDEAYAPISVLWTLQYLLLSIVLYAVETYVTREVVLHQEGRRGPYRPGVTTLGALLAVAVALTAGTWAFSSSLFAGLDDLALVAGAFVVGYGSLVLARGMFAGTGRYRDYGLVTGSESVLRLMLAVAVVAVAPSTRALAWTMPFGAMLAAAWWLVARRSTPDPDPPTDELAETARPLRFLLTTTTANAAAQLLLASGPLVLVGLGASAAEISIFFVTVTAARVPVSFAFGGLLSRILPTFTRMATGGEHEALVRAVRRIALATALLAAVGGGVASAVGSTVVAWFFGEAFTPPWWLVGGTAAGVLLATGALLLNQSVIAQSAERRLLPPWIAALLAAVAVVVVTPGSASLRVTVAFLVGEVVALVGLGIAAARTSAPAVSPR